MARSVAPWQLPRLRRAKERRVERRGRENILAAGLPKETGDGRSLSGNETASRFASGAEDGGDECIVEPAAGLGLQFGDHGGNGIEVTGIFGEDEAAEQAGGFQPEFACGAPAHAFIHQDGVGVKLEGEGEGLRLAEIETGGGDAIGDVVWRAHFEPCGQERMAAEEFGLDGRGG